MIIGVYGGSFDPFTKGHEDIVKRSLRLVDKLYIVIATNIKKNTFYSITERERQITALYKSEEKVKVTAYDGVLATFAKEVNASFLIRGIRNTIDLEMERPMAEVNRLKYGIETLFLLSDPLLSGVSSSIVRELASFGESYDEYLPDALRGELLEKGSVVEV